MNPHFGDDAKWAKNLGYVLKTKTFSSTQDDKLNQADMPTDTV